MKKMLITGGSHSEIPLIKSAHEMGYYVITTGLNEDGPGHKYADTYVYGDFSNKEFVLQLAEKENVQAIVSGCNDFAYISTAYACEILGIPGHDSYKTACVIHHKNSFRELTDRIGVKCPKYAECSDLNELLENSIKIGFPVVVKPVDLTGGKGVTICHNESDVRGAFIKAKELTREKQIITEEYISGSNHGASILIKNQRPVFIFCDDEQYYAGKYLVSGASTTVTITDEIKGILASDTEKIAKALDLTDGLFHVQFILDKNNYPVMIDPCRRAPGDLYILLVQYATGIDFAAEILKGELGIPLKECYYCENNNIIRECIMSEMPGIIEKIEIKDKLKNHIIDGMVWAKSGDVINDASKYKAGILVCRYNSPEEVAAAVKQFHEDAVIHIKQI